VAELVVLSAGVLFLLAGVGVHVWDLLAARRLGVSRRVLVQTKSGRAYTGVLWQRRRDLLVLKGAEMLEPGNQPQPMDGDVLVDRVEIDYVQVAG
jgi:hypothetical protein